MQIIQRSISINEINLTIILLDTLIIYIEFDKHANIFIHFIPIMTLKYTVLIKFYSRNNTGFSITDLVSFYFLQ